MRIIRSRDLVAVPWKNGGGTTVEIAIEPPGAVFDTFDWRLSMADVAVDGPFSCFTGIDRTLTLIEGSGLDLLVAGAPHRLDPANPILAFSGEVAVHASLPAGPIRDFNVMSRRGRVQHDVCFGGPGLHRDVAAILALDGTTIVVQGGRLWLDRFDAAVFGTELRDVDTDQRSLIIRFNSAPPQRPSATR